MKQRIDPFTGEYFYPFRSNQKFACRENQIAYNNARAKEKRDYLNEIDSFVRRNWEILLEILGDDRTTTKSEEFLNGYGYDFRFLNNIRKEGDKAYFAIYNVGIRQIDPKNYELINFECNE
jgi:hypothetical protein